MQQKPGWAYDHSEALGQDYAFKQLDNGDVDVYTADKTHYTQNEINIINQKSVTVPVQVHILKHLFGGTIIQ